MRARTVAERAKTRVYPVPENSMVSKLAENLKPDTPLKSKEMRMLVGARLHRALQDLQRGGP